MDIASLFTSAGINIGICVGFLSFYSIMRKQPSYRSIYFQRIANLQAKRIGHFSLERFIPSPSWVVKAWQTSEEEISACGGLDAVVFLRLIVFSMRIFSISAVVCVGLVLPLNYYGHREHHNLGSESLDVFTIVNIRQDSQWLWAHCAALYIISFSTCILLYFESINITRMRAAYIVGSSLNPSHFTVLVRGIPWSQNKSYNESVKAFFSKYYGSSYLSHQIVYRCGTIQKLMGDAAKMYDIITGNSLNEQHFRSSWLRCGLCGGTAHSFKMLDNEPESVRGGNEFLDSDLRDQECAASLVFFKTRYAALVTSQLLQSSDPMLWVTELAPEPNDVYWKNLCIPYRHIWIRKITMLLASIGFMLLFMLPVTIVQGMVHLQELQKKFPCLQGLLKSKIMDRIITGYLPSVVLMCFLYAAPPTMFFFSTVEGPVSRSERKKRACEKLIYFMIWNVFFVNVISGNALQRASLFYDPKTIVRQLTTAVPVQAGYYITYVLTSGWASLSVELMQPYPLLCNLFYRFILHSEQLCGTLNFPYHTEVPRVLLFVLLGFTYSIMAPLILPFLLVYFFLAYLVYRNQILNVYVTRYHTGGKYWPLIHNTTIFALVLAQGICMGVFGLKGSATAATSTMPLITLTLLFHEYCRKRFHPLFKDTAAEVLVEMDRQDEQFGRTGDLHKKLQLAYCQFASISDVECNAMSACGGDGRGGNTPDSESIKPGSKSAKENVLEVVESGGLDVRQFRA